MVSTTSETSQTNSISNSCRVAWLLQGAGAYYQPIMSEFTRLFPQTTVFTADWSGFMAGFENSFTVQQVGEMKLLATPLQTKGYGPSFAYLSPKIISHLLQFKPDVIFTTAFSLWTILALLFKALGGWRVAIVVDGSSPSIDHRNSWLRLLLRRIMTKFTDTFITNTHSGEVYLTDVLGAKKHRVFVRPYLMPHPKTYERNLENSQLANLQLAHPIFLFVGHLIPRKGGEELLKACSVLQEQGYRDYTLLVVGNGSQRAELEDFVKTHHLEERVKFVGSVQYQKVGAYYHNADVFVFPTLEDVWGMVAVEAMMFGKPILCSEWAGAAEMVVNGENGYVFDPNHPEKLAALMGRLIANPNLINSMGEKSRQIMANHSPEAISKFLAEVVEFACKN
ncbi:MAG TPA: glycosyltransferase family 4 protein [Allocoleopsis sp.]